MNALRLPARQGLVWLASSLALFRRNPPMMSLMTYAYLLVVLGLGIGHWIGQLLLSWTLPIMTVMLANGFRAIHMREPMTQQKWAEGIVQHQRDLLRLGALHLGGFAVHALLCKMLGLYQGINLEDGVGQEEIITLTTDFSIALLLAAPLLMAFYFAPLLTGWNAVSPGKALFFSFIATWRNWRAMSVYALTFFGLCFLLPELLIGLVALASPMLASALGIAHIVVTLAVFMPMFMANVYLFYRDIFVLNLPEAPQIDEVV